MQGKKAYGTKDGYYIENRKQRTSNTEHRVMPDLLVVVFVVFLIDLFSSSSILKFAASKKQKKKT